MASLTIEIWVDGDGNTRAVVDGNESHDDLDNEQPIRKVVFTVEVPEPTVQEVSVDVPAQADTDATIKIT